FISIAAEHPLALKAAQENMKLAAFIDEIRKGGVSEAELETQEKRGMATGLWAIHPVTGEDLPVYVAHFVLLAYGAVAVMAGAAGGGAAGRARCTGRSGRRRGARCRPLPGGAGRRQRGCLRHHGGGGGGARLARWHRAARGVYRTRLPDQFRRVQRPRLRRRL